MFDYLRRKFEIEDSVIELHHRARHLELTAKQPELARHIRQMADELSEKLKKEKKYEWHR